MQKLTKKLNTRMVYNIDDNIYLEVEDLEKYGISRASIKVAVNHFNNQRKNGSASNNWITLQHPTHGKKKLIKYNTISQSYFIKNNLPSEDELKQNLSVLSFQKLESEKTNANTLLQVELQNCVYKTYLEYFPRLLEDFTRNSPFDGYKRNKTKASQYARQQAVFQYLIDNIDLSNTNAVSTAFNSYLNLKLEYSCTNFTSFKRKLVKVEANGLEAIINKLNGKPSNRKKLTPAIVAIIEGMFCDPHKYTAKQIKLKVDDYTAKNNLSEISLSVIKNYLRNPEVKNRCAEKRHGVKYANDNVLSYTPLKKALYAGDVWHIDGTPIQFVCIDNNGKKIRLNLMLVLDVYSGKIVGFSVSRSEDIYAYVNALHMAVNLCGHLPNEIVTDNFSSTKTEQWKTIIDRANISGVIIRSTGVGNPTGKANIERAVKSSQYYFKLLPGFSGFGVKSRNINEQANPDFGHQHYNNTSQIFNIHEMTKSVHEIINMYNADETSNRNCPNRLYLESEKPNVKNIDAIATSLLFWKEKTIKVARSMVKITVQKTEFIYEIYDNDLKNKLNATSVIVRYDEADMSNIHLFEPETNIFICECRTVLKPHQAAANQTEYDKQLLLQHDAKKKSHRLHNQNRSEEIQEAGRAEMGEYDIHEETPFSLLKKHINDSEFNEINKTLALDATIDHSMIRERVPVEANKSYLNANKMPINKALNDTITNKKPSLEIYKPTEETE